MEKSNRAERERIIRLPFFYFLAGILILLVLLALDFYLYKEKNQSIIFSNILGKSEEEILFEIMNPVLKNFSPRNVKFEEKNGFKYWEFKTLSIAECRAQAFMIFGKLEKEGLKGRMEWDKSKPERVKLSIFSGKKQIGVVIFESIAIPEEKRGFEGEIAIIIDDIGYSIGIVKEILKIKEPLTLSVFPFLPNSKTCAEIAYASGKEIIIHMPMESNNGGDSEIGTINEKMEEDEIKERIRKAIESLPQAKGMNNHKGSKITRNEHLMEIILKELKSRNLFFIDSKTSPRSVAAKVAKRIGLPSLDRDIFIDSINSRAQIEKNVLKLFKLAKKKKRVIGIAHPYPDTIEVLKELLPQAEIYGVKPVFVSEIVMGN